MRSGPGDEEADDEHQGDEEAEREGVARPRAAGLRRTGAQASRAASSRRRWAIHSASAVGSPGAEARRSENDVAGRWSAPVACSTRAKAAARLGTAKRRDAQRIDDGRRKDGEDDEADGRRQSPATGRATTRRRTSAARATNGASSGQIASQKQFSRARPTARSMRTRASVSAAARCRGIGPDRDRSSQIRFRPVSRGKVTQSRPKARYRPDDQSSRLGEADIRPSQGAIRSMPIRSS